MKKERKGKSKDKKRPEALKRLQRNDSRPAGDVKGEKKKGEQGFVTSLLCWVATPSRLSLGSQ